MKSILLLLAIALLPQFGYAQWFPLSSPTSEDLHDILDFNSSAPIVVVGNNGVILRSTDDGATWTMPASGTTEDLISVDVVSSVQYYAGGTNGTVLVTEDNAVTWKDGSPAGVTTALSVYSRSSGFVFAVGGGGTILRGEANFSGGNFTGMNWTTQTSGTANDLNDGNGFASGSGTVVGNNGTILTTTNGGDLWTTETSGTTKHLFGFVEAGSGALLAVGADRTILKSTDGGTTWVAKLSDAGDTPDLLDISVSGQNADFMVAVGEGGLILRSTDNGETWCVQTSGTSMDLHGVLATTNSVHYAVGAGGTILKTLDGGGTCTALPVELTAFSALVDERSVTLRWETASETNNSHFEVQHKEHDTFVTLGSVEGAGTVSQPQVYTFQVDQLAPGAHAFRLKQFDFDGAVTYSPTVEVFVELPGPVDLSEAYPNPFTHTTQLALTVGRAQAVRVEVFDLLGRRLAVLYEGTLPAHTVHTIPFTAAGLSGGTYVLRVTGETFSATRTVVLQR